MVYHRGLILFRKDRKTSKLLTGSLRFDKALIICNLYLEVERTCRPYIAPVGNFAKFPMYVSHLIRFPGNSCMHHLFSSVHYNISEMRTCIYTLAVSSLGLAFAALPQNDFRQGQQNLWSFAGKLPPATM